MDAKECWGSGYRCRVVISDEQPQATDSFNLRGIELHRAEIPSICRHQALRATFDTVVCSNALAIKVLRWLCR
jgi:hypothetical protein